MGIGARGRRFIISDIAAAFEYGVDCSANALGCRGSGLAGVVNAAEKALQPSVERCADALMIESQYDCTQ